ncbi:hypothetical protein [Thiomicrorhabdus sp.]|uniref:hypothetical protein n=1 Tax=Thiomicrorhabdus sp. TaxID=2039724 RepID=UPI003564D3BD
MKKSLNKCLITAFFLFFLPSALLGSWKSPEGHFKAVGFLENWPNFEKTAGVDSETTHFLMSDFRAKTERFEKNWKFEIDYQIQGLKGETISQQRQLTSDDYDFFDLDQKQLFNLTASIVNRDDTFIYHRIDRLSATYQQRNYSVKIGRQAIRWGNGQLFNPLDHFNPFAPNSIDTEYKPGTDMVSGQYLTESGDQLDWIIVPRRNLDNRELDIDESAFGIKWLHYTDKLELQGILSKEANEWLLGVELTGNLFNGLWNMDWLSAYNTDYQAFNNSLVANYHQAWKSSATIQPASSSIFTMVTAKPRHNLI